MVQALDRIAHCFEHVSPPACDLRELMIREDAEGVWERLFETIRIMIPGNQEKIVQLTQETFLWLMSTPAFETFIFEGLTDEEMVARLLSAVTDVSIDRDSICSLSIASSC